jgi:transporter family-2 protein
LHGDAGPSAAGSGPVIGDGLPHILFGAIFIGLGIFLIPQLGAATFFALLIAGQMLGSIAFDHFGVLGVPVHPVSAIRIAGAALLVGGVILIRM